MEGETIESASEDAPTLAPPAPVESAPEDAPPPPTPAPSPADAAPADLPPAPAPAEAPAETPAETPAEAPAADATTAVSALRTWTDSTGKYHTQAQLVGISEGVVRLLRSDGRHCNVPVERLSADDRQYVETLSAIAIVH